ncbi:transposase [Streptomyces sp. NBC_01320]|nr:transposase [Streptomyces sp. NBC_01320]
MRRLSRVKLATSSPERQWENALTAAASVGATVPKDSGRISGNMRRPRRYCRRLMRVFYMSAQVAAQHCPVSKAFYERKRAEGKTHKQAVIALARRLNVLWALLRDGRPFESSSPTRAACLG